MTIREARPDEAPRLRELGVTGWETTYAGFVLPHNRHLYLDGPFWSVERLAAIAADPDCLTLVAESDGALAGFLTVEPAGPQQVELTRLYVDPEHRRGGVGKRLLDTAIDAAWRSGARSMLVNVFAENAIGRGFYEREGFRLLRLEPTTVGDQELADAWYERPLDAPSRLSDRRPGSYTPPRHRE